MGKKPDKDEIRIRLGIGALMGHLGPKGGTEGGAQGSPKEGRLKTLTLATIHIDEQYHEQYRRATVAPPCSSSSCI